MKIYDNHFNKNEWFVIIALCVGALIVYCLPKRFQKKVSGIFLLCGVFFGLLFDLTLGTFPVSFYDLNDNSQLEILDFLSHCMYAPYSYLFFYIYDQSGIRPRYSFVYILVWALLSVGIEKVSVLLGVFHYNNGYNIYYSFVIYLFVHSFWVAFYYTIQTYGNKRFYMT